MFEYMIGSVKFRSDSDDKALLKSKKIMLEKGWRNLNLMKRYNDGWGACKVIPSFETV